MFFISMLLILPVQYYLSGMAGTHQFKALFIFRVVKMMSDDRGDVQTALDHHRHLVPSFIHLSTINPLNGEAIENDFFPVNSSALGQNAQKGDLTSMAHVT